MIAELRARYVPFGLKFKDCMQACRSSIKQANYVIRKLEGKTKTKAPSSNHVSNTKSLIFSPNSTTSSQNSISFSQNVIESSQLPPLIAGSN